MLIKLLTTQIHGNWDVIKYAASKVANYDRFEDYSIALLSDLLSGNAQCFMRVDNGEIKAVAITRIVINKQENVKYLFIEGFFSFSNVAKEVYEKDWETVVAFAEKTGCEYIKFESPIRRVWEIATMLGFEEIYRGYKYPLRDDDESIY